MQEQVLFTQEESLRIIEHFGNDLYMKIKSDVPTYAEKWHLSNFQFMPYYSVNCIFICDSHAYGKAALKMARNSEELETECNMLMEYGGRGFCKLFDADLANGVLLEECILPGTQLRKEPSLEKRLEVFSSVHRGLHIPPHNQSSYPTYMDWVNKITDYISKREDYIELYQYMKKAQALCADLWERYPKRMLLHGDLHHDNMLLGKDGRYVLIDPKGVIGDPVFDVARFILNEDFDEDQEQSDEEKSQKLQPVLDMLEQHLRIPQSVIRQCFYIEMTMANCWTVDDGSSIEQHPEVMQNVRFAHKILLESKN